MNVLIVIAILAFANGAALVYLVMRNPKVDPPRKGKATMGLRRQIHQEYLDIQFNVFEDQSDEEVIALIKDMYDLSGYAHELITKEKEEENERKREDATKKGKLRSV